MNVFMKKLLLSSLFILLFFSAAISQIPGNTAPGNGNPALVKMGVIKGKIIEKGSSFGIEYANVAVYNQRDSALAGGVMADVNGVFLVKELAPGTYYIEAKFIGYAKAKKSGIKIGKDRFEVDLGTIELEPATENIQEVTVVSKDKPIAYEIDKKVIDPSQFPTSANGTAVDVLANTPSVSVDIEGNVSLRGSSNFTVLVDGRPTPFSAADALQQIPASTIRNIEVITNPSAKFDPDGNSGIININTKKTKQKGVSGILNASGDTFGSISGDFLLNYKSGKFNFFVGGNKADRKGMGSGESINITYGKDTITTNSLGENFRNFDSYSLKTGFDYYINDKNTLTLTANINGRNRAMGGTNDFSEISTSGFALNTLTESSSEGVGKELAFSLDYKKTFDKAGEELTAFLQFENGNDDEYTFFNRYLNDTIFYNGQKNWEMGNDNDFRFKLDYVLPITAKMKLETGYQARIEKETGWNDVHWYTTLDDYQPSDTSSYYTHSNFDQNIHSLYATVSNSGKIFGYQLGLRTEYTNWLITYSGSSTDFSINRWDFFPSLHLSFNLSDKQQMTTSYTRRIQRPRGFYFEPYKTYVDAYNIRVGNPAIKPEYIDSYELGYQLQLTKGFISSELYHRVTNDKIEQVRSVYSENVMLQTVSNIGKDYSTGVELMFNYKPTSWWMFNVMGNIYEYRIKGELYGSAVDQSSTNWNARFNNTFTITKTTKLQIDGMYNSPTTSAQGKREGFAYTNLAIRQDFFDNKLNVTFSVRDVLNTAKFGFESSGPDFYSKSNYDMRSPVFALSLSFKINNFKQQRPKNGENGGNGEMMEMEGNGGME
jgi:outer membrane receptor protein involved in Fe transport